MVIELKDHRSDTDRDKVHTEQGIGREAEKEEQNYSERIQSLHLMSRQSIKAEEHCEQIDKRDSEELLVIKENKF